MDNHTLSPNASKVLAITGGSCSGKSTLANAIAKRLGPEQCTLLMQDDYYYTNGGVTSDKNVANFDHPEAIEFDLLGSHIDQLKQGQPIQTPVYDFFTHTRSSDVKILGPRPIIIVDGILLLHDKSLREKYDFSIFIECDEKLRRNRRIERDVIHRGRTRESVQSQFQNQVVPMHNQFVEPSKLYANITLNQSLCDDEVHGRQSTILERLEAV